mmetsp:Transcript_113688/g.321473  ORF Transcript_113688/g.321473 Transcript_113688/m.321473 type:complete len:273 (-) Transcript_113688:2194-3012(-)
MRPYGLHLARQFFEPCEPQVGIRELCLICGSIAGAAGTEAPTQNTCEGAVVRSCRAPRLASAGVFRAIEDAACKHFQGRHRRVHSSHALRHGAATRGHDLVLASAALAVLDAKTREAVLRDTQAAAGASQIARAAGAAAAGVWRAAFAGAAAPVAAIGAAIEGARRQRGVEHFPHVRAHGRILAHPLPQLDKCVRRLPKLLLVAGLALAAHISCAEGGDRGSRADVPRADVRDSTWLRRRALSSLRSLGRRAQRLKRCRRRGRWRRGKRRGH